MSEDRYLVTPPAGKTGVKPRPLSERFWARVDKRGPDDCWEWQGSRNEHGYGGIREHGQFGALVGTHRVAYMLANPNEELTSADHVCHHCDNPPCCNPAHLYRGNYRTNTDDKVRRGRQLTGAALSAVLRPHMPRGDAHWTRRMPERINNPKGRPAWNKGQRMPHGTPGRYGRGCRCDECRQANTEYKRQFRKRKVC